MVDSRHTGTAPASSHSAGAATPHKAIPAPSSPTNNHLRPTRTKEICKTSIQFVAHNVLVSRCHVSSIKVNYTCIATPGRTKPDPADAGNVTSPNDEASPVMTKLELIRLIVGHARTNGFEFRKWYVTHLGLPWSGTVQATETLAEQRRYYVLLFSHDFASHFWKAGEQITFQVPTQTFLRRRADGTIGSVTRKAFTRRSAREDVWLYHLRELAASEEPLRYMRRYLPVVDDVDPEPAGAAPIPESPTQSWDIEEPEEVEASDLLDA